METASQILERKGYDNSEQDEIVCSGYKNNDSLDIKVREEFCVDEPIHLLEAYYLGDAGEDVLNEIAKKRGFDDYKDLLNAMDYRLLELAKEYPDKK